MSDNLTFRSGLLAVLSLLAAIGCPGCDQKPDPAQKGNSQESPPPAKVSWSATTPSGKVREKVEIILPDGPPASDTVEDGTYVLSVHIELDNGASVDDHHACNVKVTGADIAIDLERSKEKLAGTLKDGRLTVNPREGPGSYGLEGQVTGPGKLAGKVVGGAPLEGVRIVEGRWSLARVK
jgi:hypothetical protein